MDTAAHRKFKILLVGDDCRDLYHFGRVTRLSPEAPVPVFEPTHQQIFAGMAANVARNLQTLGCEVQYVHTQTSVKERLIDSRSKQHVLRIDRDVECDPVAVDSLVFDGVDAVVVSDYNKGTVTDEFIVKLRQLYSGPVFVDTKKTDLAQFEGCWIKINLDEHTRARTLPADQWTIVTCGAQGTVWNWQKFPAYPAGDVVDVCGAGDTFLAALTWNYLITDNMPAAIEFANRAAAVTVQHVGVYAPSLEEIDAITR